MNQTGKNVDKISAAIVAAINQNPGTDKAEDLVAVLYCAAMMAKISGVSAEEFSRFAAAMFNSNLVAKHASSVVADVITLRAQENNNAKP